MSRLSHRNPRDGDGFALVEAIAVLALSALVLLALLTAIDLVTRNSAAASRRISDTEAMVNGLAALKRDIEATQYFVLGADASDGVLFVGGPHSMGLVVAGTDSDSTVGESLVWIEAQAEGDQNTLIRSSAPLLVNTTGFAGAQLQNPVRLLSGPWTYRFAYADDRAGFLFWQNTWTASQFLPAAVRLEVLGAGGAPVVPAFVVRVRVDAGAG